MSLHHARGAARPHRSHGGLRRQWVGGILAAMLVAMPSCRASDAAETDGLFGWTISTAFEIDAPPELVWQVLVDLPAYSEWNPFIVEASGTVAAGETLSLRMALPGRTPMTITPRLLVVAPSRELRWQGQLLLPGLFDGEHVFELTPIADARTRVHHWERFGGLLLPIARGIVYDATLQAFHALNTALAQRSEQRMIIERNGAGTRAES